MDESTKPRRTPSVHSETDRQFNGTAYNHDVEDQFGPEYNGPDTAAHEKAPKDPNIVDWNGLDNSAHPMNWSLAKKVASIGLVSLITVLS
jgi:hypothetical protein